LHLLHSHIHSIYLTFIFPYTWHLKLSRTQFKQRQISAWLLAICALIFDLLYGTRIVYNYRRIAALGELVDRVCNPANSLAVETALLAYDSLLTMDPEIGYIWKTKFKLGTALYLLARYIMLLDQLFMIIQHLLKFPSPQVCFF
jgi:Family of unknown function (DUF6533)